MHYLEIAAHLAKDHAARLRTAETGLVTHWQTWDVPMAHGEQQAACGTVMHVRREFSTTPTCPACRQALARYEAMDFGQ